MGAALPKVVATATILAAVLSASASFGSLTIFTSTWPLYLSYAAAVLLIGWLSSLVIYLTLALLDNS